MSDEHREVLERLSRSQTAADRDVQRARALLLAGDGVANTHIAAQVDVSPATVKAWRERFSEEGAEGVWRRARRTWPQAVDQLAEDR